MTSKRYAPDESWTKEKAWWIQVPAAAIKEGKTIHIVCEAERRANRFATSKCPRTFFNST